MTDTEINKALALKIGYLPEHIDEYYGQVRVNRPLRSGEHWWYVFDFMAWNTIMPIAVKYGVRIVPATDLNNLFTYAIGVERIYSDTLQRAIALAVLGVKE